MTSNARSMMAWTSSGSSRSDIAVKPDTSENITVTLLRSPSSAPREVRIFSARCLGVYAAGAASRRPGFASGAGELSAGALAGAAPDAGIAARRTPHSPQNFWPVGLTWPQAGQAAGSRAPHSPQYLLDAGFSAWQAGQDTMGFPITC